MTKKNGPVWMNISEGVTATRLRIQSNYKDDLDVMPRDMLWITTLEGSVSCTTPSNKKPQVLRAGDSALMMWPRSPWKCQLRTQESTQVCVCRISLEALHSILAVDYHDSEDAGARVDYRQLASVVHFSPARIRDMGRLFIQSADSRFKSIARQGVFLDLFAEMLELLYGSEVSQCPFQIDADTERKIRTAHSIIVENLGQTPDIGQLAIEVDLPKPVLREGFSFIFGKPISDYVTDYRFERARVMLESGQYLIKQVAFEIGYQNPSHFISAFKQRYGTTPKQWVKQQA